MNTMAPQWKYSEIEPISKWKVGLYIWRKNGFWRVRLYRPWRSQKLIEIQSESLRWNIYLVGIGAGWWKDINASSR